MGLCAATGTFHGHHNVLGKLLGRTALLPQHTFEAKGEHRQQDFWSEGTSPLTGENFSSSKGSLWGHFKLYMQFWFSFSFFSLASCLGLRNKIACVQWSWPCNLWFNFCPSRTVDRSSKWSAGVSCKYLKVFSKASPNFPGLFRSNAFLYLSWLQIKYQPKNCNNSLSLAFDLKNSSTQ